MAKLIVTNRKITLEDVGRKALRRVEAVTAYKVAGYFWSPAYRAHVWDGKEHLLNFSTKSGYTAPSGLLEDVKAAIESGERVKVVDKTIVRNERRELLWNHDIVMRDYQERAVEAFLANDGRGVIKMPTRSGKTKTAARLIWRLGLPALFVVPSKLLLHQTVRELKNALPDAEVGMLGDGIQDLQFITVATIQTLSRLRGRRGTPGKTGVKSDPLYKQIAETFDVLVADEAHHVRGEGEWYHSLYELDARYRCGLSATAFPDLTSEAEKGIIWLKGICGPIVIDISVSELVARGFLMQQNVRMYRITRPDLRGKRWSNELRARGITQNVHRNKIAVQLARRHIEAGRKVLIVADRLDHIAALAELCDAMGVDHRVITGRDSQSERESKIDGFTAGEYGLLIGTVLREGVDIPSMEVVINVEGGQDLKNTIQRQRNLTLSEGKKEAILVDFMDETNEYFKKHSKARLKAYRSESAFTVKLVNVR